MLFLGIDLAWSEKNKSGVAIIEGNGKRGELIDVQLALSDEEIVGFVTGHAGKNDALVAVDAPLVVPNKTGRRIAEERVGDLFRKYSAGAHPSNRTRLGAWSDGKIRGEELVKELASAGFAHDPIVSRLERSRKVFEVYPHPSMVVLFGLDRILQYKAKPKRGLEFRINEFEKYKRLLKGLKNPSLNLGGFLDDDLSAMTISALKGYEDRIDAVFCAHIAHYYWANPEKCTILGSMKGGYIMTPVFGHMQGSQKVLRNNLP